MYKIRYIGDPILRKKTTPINTFDEKTGRLVRDMIDIMHREDGIGLAGPQVGIDKRILVVDISPIDENAEPTAFINPEILESQGSCVEEEGCLSIPGIREEVTRPEAIKLTYQNELGETFTEEYDGWMARVLQHEIDHLNGILFVDHISPIKRRMLISGNMIPAEY